MEFSFSSWGEKLEDLIVRALLDFKKEVSEEMTMFSVDCHPWHGRIGLAFLSRKEAEKTPFLKDPDEIAGWDFFNFADKPFFYEVVGKEMENHYYESNDDQDGVSHQFFVQVAAVISSERVQAALQSFQVTKDFKITITHPDSGKEFYKSSLKHRS